MKNTNLELYQKLKILEAIVLSSELKKCDITVHPLKIQKLLIKYDEHSLLKIYSSIKTKYENTLINRIKKIWRA
jgi:hypothetical protein